MRAKIHELAETSDSDVDDLPSVPPSQWSRSDWEHLANLVPSKAQGAQRIHKDVRTVTRYLKALALRWSKDGIKPLQAPRKAPTSRR